MYLPAILSIAMLASAALPAAAASDVAPIVKLRYGDAGRNVRVAAGQPVRIALPAHVGSSYRWVVRPGRGFAVTAPIRVEADPATPRLDATIVRLIFTRRGSTTVELANVPPGSGGGAASDVIKYHFAVE